MKTIQYGKINLSEEIYLILSNDDPFLKKGYKVRLVSGVDGNSEPGYHWNPEYVTVCPLDTPSYTLGVRKDLIRPYRKHKRKYADVNLNKVPTVKDLTLAAEIVKSIVIPHFQECATGVPKVDLTTKIAQAIKNKRCQQS